MRPRFIFWFGLIAVLAISACAPTVTSIPAAPEVPSTQEATAASAPVDSSAPAATEEPAAPVLAVATSRGPNLEATDPSTVSLASGQLQLVEFFRFT